MKNFRFIKNKMFGLKFFVFFILFGCLHAKKNLKHSRQNFSTSNPHWTRVENYFSYESENHQILRNLSSKKTPSSALILDLPQKDTPSHYEWKQNLEQEDRHQQYDSSRKSFDFDNENSFIKKKHDHLLAKLFKIFKKAEKKDHLHIKKPILDRDNLLRSLHRSLTTSPIDKKTELSPKVGTFPRTKSSKTSRRKSSLWTHAFSSESISEQ